MRIIAIVLFSIILVASVAYGGDRQRSENSPPGYDSDGNYSSDQLIEDVGRSSRGRISANPYAPDSIFNEYNIETGPRAIDSLTNPNNPYQGASPYEIDGWNNPFAIDGGFEVPE